MLIFEPSEDNDRELISAFCNELTDVKLKSMQNNLIFDNIDENEEENCLELGETVLTTEGA
jgi:hypothetical protein